MHELVDREYPKCLYCNSVCDFKLDGRVATILNPTPYNVEILTCNTCNEVFEIHSWDEDDGNKISDFVFTCKDLAVIHKYPQPSGTSVGFNIGNRSNLWPKMFKGDVTVLVNPFNIDFSDKKKLHKKLKTYLVFS